MRESETLVVLVVHIGYKINLYITFEIERFHKQLLQIRDIWKSFIQIQFQYIIYSFFPLRHRRYDLNKNTVFNKMIGVNQV